MAKLFDIKSLKNDGNYTMKHNNLPRKIMRFIPPTAYCLLDLIISETIGWQKLEVQFTNKQLCEIMGCQKNGLLAAQKALLAIHGLLTITELNTEHNPRLYKINPDFDSDLVDWESYKGYLQSTTCLKKATETQNHLPKKGNCSQTTCLKKATETQPLALKGQVKSQNTPVLVTETNELASTKESILKKEILKKEEGAVDYHGSTALALNQALKPHHVKTISELNQVDNMAKKQAQKIEEFISWFENEAGAKCITIARKEKWVDIFLTWIKLFDSYDLMKNQVSYAIMYARANDKATSTPYAVNWIVMKLLRKEHLSGILPNRKSKDEERMRLQMLADQQNYTPHPDDAEWYNFIGGGNGS